MEEFNLSHIAPNNIRSSCDVKMDVVAHLEMEVFVNGFAVGWN